MYPILFSIGKYSIYTHGVMAVLGMVLGALLAYKLAKREGLDTTVFFDNIIFTILFGVIGSRLAYFLVYSNQFDSAMEILYIWQGGLISYGGFVIGGIAFLTLIKTQRQSVRKWLDVAVPGFFLGLAFGRIGDILAGEYNGIQTVEPVFAGLEKLFPVSLFESLLCLLIFVISLIIYFRYSQYLREGALAWGSIMIYTLGRFFLDFARTESDIIWKISLGQLFGLLLFLMSLVFLFNIFRKREEQI